MRRVFLAVAACLLLAHRVDAADWNSLRTEHFLLLGDVSPRAIKDVALRFEQFRSAVTSTFTVLADDRPGPPVIVIIFRNQRAYEPYQPRFNGKPVKVGGYFLGGRDVNYITLTGETGGDDFRAVYHEYTHLLMPKLAGDFSPWFHEGLAEYFSTFEANGNTARFGRPIGSHVDLLRERQMRLSELFAVTHDSTTYNEGDRRSLFYAQSWLLVHYAFVEHPDRWKQLVQFETLVDRGVATDGAFQQVFNTRPSVLEKELFDYARQAAMHFQVVELDQRVVTRLQAEPVRLSEPEAQARLGDLLAHAGRNDEATTLLTNVLKTAPELPLAHAALGALLLRQDKGDEAMAHLERAAAARDADEFVQFSGEFPSRAARGPTRGNAHLRSAHRNRVPAATDRAARPCAGRDAALAGGAFRRRGFHQLSLHYTGHDFVRCPTAGGRHLRYVASWRSLGTVGNFPRNRRCPGTSARRVRPGEINDIAATQGRFTPAE